MKSLPPLAYVDRALPNAPVPNDIDLEFETQWSNFEAEWKNNAIMIDAAGAAMLGRGRVPKFLHM
jgi:hypothetical protein